MPKNDDDNYWDVVDRTRAAADSVKVRRRGAVDTPVVSARRDVPGVKVRRAGETAAEHDNRIIRQRRRMRLRNN